MFGHMMLVSFANPLLAAAYELSFNRVSLSPAAAVLPDIFIRGTGATISMAVTAGTTCYGIFRMVRGLQQLHEGENQLELDQKKAIRGMIGGAAFMAIGTLLFNLVVHDAVWSNPRPTPSGPASQQIHGPTAP